MAIVLVFKLPLLDFKLLGSEECNEVRIDRWETRRGQVSCSDCRESSRLEVERREDNFLLVFYTGSPLRSHRPAQITHERTKCSQVVVLIGLFGIRRQTVVKRWWFDWFVTETSETKPRGDALFVCGLGTVKCVAHLPNAHQDIAVTHLKIFLPSPCGILVDYKKCAVPGFSLCIFFSTIVQ